MNASNDAPAEPRLLTGRRVILAGLTAAGAALAGLPSLFGRARPADMAARSVLDDIPPTLHGPIRARAVTADLAPFFDRSARAAAAQGLALYVPAGTYTMPTWSPPAGLTVLTDGRDTVFKQLDTRGKPQRFIEVGADGVRLWPGGSATIDGGMTEHGANATAFNSGVRVHAGPGARIDSFECGTIYGVDIGGDVLETGCAATGHLGRCTIGTLYGDNVYRNILSITGGRSGTVQAVVQSGGCGLMALDIEPDPASAPVGSWTIGLVRGNRASVVGDAAAGVEAVTIRQLDLDRQRPASAPAFAVGGVSERKTPALFDTGLRYRNIGSLHIDQASIANFPRAAIEDIGSAAADSPTEQVAVGSLTIIDCGAQTGYQVTTQKTGVLAIETLEARAKPPAVATFLGGRRMTLIRVGGGNVAGRVVLAAEGDIEIGRLAVTGGSERIFRHVRGRISLDGVTGADAFLLFDDCTGPIEIANSDLWATEIAQGSGPLTIRRSRINGRNVE